MNKNISDLIFRLLFSMIFLGLGGEHLLSDDLIQHLMPPWVPMRRGVSILCGIWLTGWGGCILLGFKVRLAAIALGVFLLVVTAFVHLPAVFGYPATLSADCFWLWDILQRSTLAKNLCLLGVCFHLLHHEVGTYSLEAYLKSRKMRARK